MAPGIRVNLGYFRRPQHPGDEVRVAPRARTEPETRELRESPPATDSEVRDRVRIRVE